MRHRDSYGAVLTLLGGMRVVYSGDCRPSESLAAVGRGCALLIHEATFGDCLPGKSVNLF